MTLDPIVIKVAAKAGQILAKPALRKLASNEHVVALLETLGYSNLENEFENLYVHTLVARRRQGADVETLGIFKERRVVKAFNDSWREDNPQVFEDTVRFFVAHLAKDRAFADVDVLRECRAFHFVFTDLAKKALNPGEQQMTKTLEEISHKVASILKRMPSKRSKPSPTSGELLNAYLRDLRSETYRIEIKGIYSESGAGRQPAYFPIEEHYTPLKAVSGGEQEREVEEESIEASEMQLRSRREQEEKKPALSEFLSNEKHLLIIGDPGSGKTTFVRFVACVLAKDGLGDTLAGRAEHLGLAADAEPPVPVFLRITHLARCLRDNSATVVGGRPWVWLLRALAEQWSQEAADVLRERLDTGNCFVLLDGLDEVSDEMVRRQVHGAVNAAVEHWQGNRFVVTSRPFGYHAVAGIQNMQPVRISRFGNDEIIEFINRWGTAIYPDEDERNRKAYVPQLRSAVLSKTRIRGLARNPVMLTCLCVVHWNEKRLPEGKAQLLAAVLRWLINAREKERREIGFNSFFAEECFRTLAYAMTTHGKGKQVSVDLLWAAGQLAAPFQDQMKLAESRQLDEARRFLETEMMNSGVVIKDGSGDLRFWHLSFQEHYAGSTLVGLDRAEWWKEIREHLYDAQWNEVIDHFAGCLMIVPSRRSIDFLIQRIIELTSGDLRSKVRMVAVAGRLLRLLRVYEYEPPERVGWQKALTEIKAVFDSTSAGSVPAADRIAAAEVLGWSGDSRFRSVEPEMLPIPGLEDVLLGKYPVTVEEYQRFVDNGGYDDPRFWGEWWDKKEWGEPGDWDEQLEHRNRPVTGISWYEAAAYCKWLAANTGKAYRLPADKEWEVAATHADGGEYPWGDEEPSEELLNFDMNVGKPTPVGVYPAGVAAGGHLDMAGNVWEWCEDLSREFGGSLRVYRGGGWDYSAHYCRSAYRHDDHPGYRGSNLGFRLSRSVP